MKLIFFITSFFFCTYMAPLNAEELFISSSTDIAVLGKYLEILEDSTGTITFDEVSSDKFNTQFQKSSVDTPYLNFTNSTIWVRFTLHNASELSDFYIQLSYPLMDHIDFFRSNTNSFTKISTGYLHPFDTRELKNNSFVFRTKIPKNKSKTYYFRFRNEDRMEIPLTLWTTDAFHKADHDNQFTMGIYAGFILLLTLINLVMFFALRDRTFIYHTAFIIVYSLFQFTQSGYTFEYLTPHNFYHLNHHVPFNIAVLIISVLFFSSSYLELKNRNPGKYRLTLILCGIIALSTPLQFITPYSLAVYIQLVFSVIGLVFIQYTIICSILNKYKPAYFFAAGISAMLIGGLLYAFKVAGFLPSIFIVNYGLQIGSLIHFSLVTVGLGLKINMVYEGRIEADRQAAISRERYKALVEGSEECIFTLSENLKFLSANKSTKKHLMISSENIIGTSFLDIIYEDNPEGEATTTQFIREKLDLFKSEKQPIRFHLTIKTKELLEPKNIDIHLQYIDYAGKTEILGRAQAAVEDNLLIYFHAERQVYKMENYLLTANDMTQRITRNLLRYISEKEINILRIALREIIINAIEHGNLGITYEEKTLAKIEGNYFEFLAKRRTDPEYSSKKVTVEFSISRKKVEYIISDEGDGFDYNKYLNDDSNEANEQGHSHGRGISMTKNIFDEVEYNNTGNSVRLVKYFTAS